MSLTLWYYSVAFSSIADTSAEAAGDVRANQGGREEGEEREEGFVMGCIRVFCVVLNL